MATPAHVITLGLEPAMNASIRAWFKQFNFLPPIPLTAGRIDTVTANGSFEHLLELLIQSPLKDFILIIHGHSDGSGLYIPLSPGQTKIHTEHWDLQKLMEVDAGQSKMSHADTARMGISRHHIQKLLHLMHRVREKKIHCIEFRSCNLGKNILSLNRFREFLGAGRVGAPDLHTLFGLPGTLVGPRFLETHAHHHPGKNWETYKFPHAFGAPRLVCCFQLNHLQKPEAGGHIIADTAATFDAWVKQYVMAKGHRSSEHQMAMHALWIADIAVKPHHKGDPDHRPVFIPADTDGGPLGTWGNEALVVRRLIPPLSDDYRKHIVYAG
jgi:hypothetical protein